METRFFMTRLTKALITSFFAAFVCTPLQAEATAGTFANAPTKYGLTRYNY